MGGRDHETDHDGECFPDCRECRLGKLEAEVKNLKHCLQRARRYNTLIELQLKEADKYRLTLQEWNEKWT